MMKRLKLVEAKRLVAAKMSPAVSIYVGTDVQGQDSQRTIAENLNRLFGVVERTIRKRFGETVGQRILSGLKQAINGVKLRRARGGLAIYHSQGFTGMLHLPTPVRDLAVTADSFHLKPVLKACQVRRSFYLLTFANKAADFYKVTADKITKLESTRYYAEKHSISYGPRLTEYRVRKRNEVQDWMERLHQKIDLHASIEKLPLLLGGSLYHQDIFRDSTLYPNLVEGGMSGNLTRQTDESLFQHSSLFMERYFSSYQEHAIKSFERAELSGETSSRLDVIATAAVDGNIRHLFVAEDRHIWGNFNRDTGRIHLLPESQRDGNDDILDDLAEVTLLMRGEVTVLPLVLMPDGQPIAAILKASPTLLPATREIRGYVPGLISGHAGHSINLSA